jgi:hypothetical protein
VLRALLTTYPQSGGQHACTGCSSPYLWPQSCENGGRGPKNNQILSIAASLNGADHEFWYIHHGARVVLQAVVARATPQSRLCTQNTEWA